jgi:DUF1365 family protein
VVKDPAALYRCVVTHTRVQPFYHHFRYRVFSLLLDLDRLEEAIAPVRFFSLNRFNILSFHEKDHGDGSSQGLRSWVDTQLAKAGLETGGRIRLLCFPRLWGYVFNPLAVYFCEDKQGRCRAILHQVSNTFGERHNYLLKVDDQHPLRQQCQKVFHVSPFLSLEGIYRFRLRLPNDLPNDTLSILIRHQDAEGNDRLIAAQTGYRQTFNASNLLKCLFAHPLMSFKVIAAIHYQAFKLWIKGARFHKQPAAPAQSLSIDPAFRTNIPDNKSVA